MSRIVWLLLIAVVLIAAPASAETWVDWDCGGFARSNFTTLIFPVISSSPALPAAQFYISTVNPRPSAPTPQHLRVQWNFADEWKGRIVFEGGLQSSRHLFVTMYVSHSPNWQPFTIDGNQIGAKQVVLKTNSGFSVTYLQSAGFGPGIYPMVGIQDIEGRVPGAPTGANNFYQNQGVDTQIIGGSGYHRLDYEVMLNDPGQSNGIVRMYIDSIKVMDRTGVDMGATSNDIYSYIDVDFLGAGNVHDNGNGTFSPLPGNYPMFRDMDRLWVSTTAFDSSAPSMNAPGNPKICRGVGCTPAMLPLPAAALLFWLRRRLKRA